MTTEEKARAYAEKELACAIRRHAHPLDKLAPYFDFKDIQQAYLAGAAEALASQWKDPKVELPEEKKPVLCFMADMKDPYAEKNSYFDMAILLEGEVINLDAEIVRPTFWMPIPFPPLKGGDE